MGQSLNADVDLTDEMVISVSGLAKLFVGELMDVAIDIMKEENEEFVSTDHLRFVSVFLNDLNLTLHFVCTHIIFHGFV